MTKAGEQPTITQEDLADKLKNLLNKSDAAFIGQMMLLYGDVFVAALRRRTTPLVVQEQSKDWREVEAEVRQHWKWGNLTRLGAVNMLVRGGWRMEAAIEKSNDICGPVVKPASLAAQDGLVEALDDATIDEIILNFAGGIVQVPSKQNPRGYVSYYRPREAMRAALSAIMEKSDG